MKNVKKNTINFFLRYYKRLLVSVYSTHFNQNKYEEKFIGIMSGILIIFPIAFVKLLIMVLGLNPIEADINFELPTFTFIIVINILNGYYYKNIFPKDYIIELADNYEYYFGDLKKRFWFFYTILSVFEILVWAVLYSFYKSSFY